MRLRRRCDAARRPVLPATARQRRRRRRLLICLLLVCLLLAARPGQVRAQPNAPTATTSPTTTPATGPATGFAIGPATALATVPSMVPAAEPGLDRSLVGGVIDTALAVLEPRTLEPHTARQLAVWGLSGITAIDPALTVDAATDASAAPVRLATPAGMLFAAPPPAADDRTGWARLAVAMTASAWTASGPMREAGQQAVIQSFFDELFNHLDPYSRYVAPAPADSERAARNGGTAGAGVTLAERGADRGAERGGQGGGQRGRGLVIASVNANGPAWSAGISAGMRLLSVDGRPVRGLQPDQAAALLQGDAGTVVTLVLAGANDRMPASYRLIRAAVPPETVFAFSNGDIVVIRVTGFSADTAQEISQFLEQATGGDDPGPPAPKPRAARLHGLIFDLRGNRGGLLQQAVTAVALVLDHGVAVTAVGRDPQANHVWAVQGGDLTDGVPIVVLVDGRTASAAEIMAAALADHRRAVVVGSATLGKGLVQTIAQLPDGGELFVTWSRVLAPLGWPLQGLGVIPQVCTSLGQSSLDRQLQDLAAGTFDERRAVVDSRAARAPLPVARVLELRQACPAAIGSDGDLDAARSLLQTPGSYEAALVPEAVE